MEKTKVIGKTKDIDGEELPKKETRLSKILVFVFLLFIGTIEAGMWYFQDIAYHESKNLGIDLTYAIVPIMVTVFIYFFTFFQEGKWTTFFRNILIFSLSMILVVIITFLRFEIQDIKSDIEQYECVSVESINEKFANYEKKLNKLEQQNIELTEYIKKQNHEYIGEFIINRKAINAQQRVIQRNSQNIESSKKYRLIKNPF